MQFQSKLSEIVSSQKTTNIFLEMLTSLVFYVASKGKKILKIYENS